MSQTIDNKLRDMFRDWGEEPQQDAWAVISDKRKGKAVPFLWAGDDNLRDVFQEWGEEPMRNAWDLISNERTQRVLEKNKKRRRILLAFFSGCLLMSILLLPFIILKRDMQPANKEIITTAAGPELKSKHAPETGNGEYPGIPSKPAPTGSTSGNKKAKAHSSPVADTYDNTFKSFDNSTYAPEEDRYTGLGMIELKKTLHPYHVILQAASITWNYKLGAKPGTPRFGLTLIMQLGYLNETTRLISLNNPGSAHRDATNYGKWLTAPQTGFSISADVNKSFINNWIIQAGFTYRNSEQRVQYDYTYRDVPVFWQGRIAGYIHLDDTLATVYKTVQVNTSQKLNISLGVGRQLINKGRWRVAAFVHVAPNLAGNSKGSLLNLNRNAFESISGLMRNKSIPYGISARFTYRIANGTEMFLQYSRSNNRQSLRFSGADMLISTTGNKITLGFQYPLIKQ